MIIKFIFYKCMSLVRVYIYIASYIVYRTFCFLYFVLSHSYYIARSLELAFYEFGRKIF